MFFQTVYLLNKIPEYFILFCLVNFIDFLKLFFKLHNSITELLFLFFRLFNSFLYQTLAKFKLFLVILDLSFKFIDFSTQLFDLLLVSIPLFNNMPESLIALPLHFNNRRVQLARILSLLLKLTLNASQVVLRTLQIILSLVFNTDHLTLQFFLLNLLHLDLLLCVTQFVHQTP